MPADAAAAHFVVGIARRRHQRLRRLARDVPGEARNQDRRHHRRREDDDAASGEAPPRRQTINLHSRDNQQVQ